MALSPAAETESSIAARYEALLRGANSIRARKAPQDLFEILVCELSKAIPFDAIAHFDAPADTVRWHLGAACRKPDDWQADHAENLPRLVYRTQEPVILRTLGGEIQPPELTRPMQEAGIESLCVFPLTTAHSRLGSLLFGSQDDLRGDLHNSRSGRRGRDRCVLK